MGINNSCSTTAPSFPPAACGTQPPPDSNQDSGSAGPVTQSTPASQGPTDAAKHYDGARLACGGDQNTVSAKNDPPNKTDKGNAKVKARSGKAKKPARQDPKDAAQKLAAIANGTNQPKAEALPKAPPATTSVTSNPATPATPELKSAPTETAATPPVTEPPTYFPALQAVRQSPHDQPYPESASRTTFAPRPQNPLPLENPLAGTTAGYPNGRPMAHPHSFGNYPPVTYVTYDRQPYTPTGQKGVSTPLRYRATSFRQTNYLTELRGHQGGEKAAYFTENLGQAIKSQDFGAALSLVRAFSEDTGIPSKQLLLHAKDSLDLKIGDPEIDKLSAMVERGTVTADDVRLLQKIGKMNNISSAKAVWMFIQDAFGTGPISEFKDKLTGDLERKGKEKLAKAEKKDPTDPKTTGDTGKTEKKAGGKEDTSEKAKADPPKEKPKDKESLPVKAEDPPREVKNRDIRRPETVFV